MNAPAIRGIARAPGRWARIAGVFYLITFVAGIFALWAGGNRGAIAGAVAGASYVALQPWVFGPGIIGEGALTLWLLAVGLNEQKWIERRGGRV